MNRLTPGSNMRWEGMRMMLPEHREALLEHKLQQKIQERPEHDESVWEDFMRLLNESKESGRMITIKIYGKFEHSGENGIVKRLDRELGIKFNNQWIDWSDVISVE